MIKKKQINSDSYQKTFKKAEEISGSTLPCKEKKSYTKIKIKLETNKKRWAIVKHRDIEGVEKFYDL